MKLSIATPVLNGFNYTKAYLDDLSYLTDCEVVLFDNGSTDQTKDIEKLDIRKPKNLKIIRSEENLGFARGSNGAFANSSGEYVLFLNNDIRVKSNKEGWAHILIENASNGIVGPNGGLLDGDLNFIRETTTVEPGNFYMSGWCLLAARETWNKLILPGDDGPFSTEFRVYFEDSDVGFRARRMGIELKIVPVPVVHFGKQTTKHLGISKLYTEARSVFVKKWAGK